MNICDSPVLILEQSVVVVNQLTRYLNRLGFKQIFPFSNIDNAIEKFTDLVNRNYQPLIFLAFDHSGTDAISILPRFYSISTNTKVIIETARTRDDDGIKQLISMGVFYYITKPFHFEDINKVINTIQNDEELLSDFMEKDKEFLLKILDGTQRISINRLSEITKLSKEKIASILNHLKNENKIMLMGITNEAMCKSCSSVQVSPIFFCRSCMSSNFEKQKLIEHLTCGNMSSDQDYSDDKCPACRKKITALGLDYKIHYTYMCIDCSDRFPYPEFNVVCLGCGDKSTMEELKWSKSQSVIALCAAKNKITINNFENVLENEFGTDNSTTQGLIVSPTQK